MEDRPAAASERDIGDGQPLRRCIYIGDAGKKHGRCDVIRCVFLPLSQGNGSRNRSHLRHSERLVIRVVDADADRNRRRAAAVVQRDGEILDRYLAGQQRGEIGTRLVEIPLDVAVGVEGRRETAGRIGNAECDAVVVAGQRDDAPRGEHRRRIGSLLDDRAAAGSRIGEENIAGAGGVALRKIGSAAAERDE